MQTFPHDETQFIFKGPVGNIEVWVKPCENAAKTAIICHPHPLFGGTMTNKVVTTLAKALHELGLNTVRFNFRGVGKTEGVHDEGRGEAEDVLAIARWVYDVRPKDNLWLAGFSFGGYVAARAASQLPAEQLISIAPQVSRFFDAPIGEISCPWLIVQGEKDDVVSPLAVYEWIKTLNPEPTLIRLPDAGHFFHGQLGVLQKVLVQSLQS
jgi:alpha/beta superfamily hydrolase